jgi:type 1 glutamine amidotransferase
MKSIGRSLKLPLWVFWLGVLCLNTGRGADAPKQVLFFSKSAGYEHPISYRDTAWPSFLETEMLKLGNSNHIFFTFSKDGPIFTPENIAKYDAFVFYTSGNLTEDKRDGWGDNYPMMTPAGWEALRQAVRNGKGFMGLHSAIESLDDFADATTGQSSGMLGARYIGHDESQRGHLVQLDRKFPGMELVPPDYRPLDQWYALKDFQPDLHVIMALDGTGMKGKLYDRPIYPLVWARMEGRGRVFYTAMGHSFAIWRDPIFRRMILGGVQWVSGQANASVTPNLGQVTPRANEIPASARQTAPERRN